jgi:hypothetical protein
MEGMAAVGTSSGIGVESRIDKIVSELKGYIASGFVTLEEVALLLQEDPKLRLAAKSTTENEQPSVTEVNVSNVHLDMIYLMTINKPFTIPKSSDYTEPCESMCISVH